MIIIKKIYPFDNFSQNVYEFGEDRVSLKTNSITSTYTYEFEYKNIATITDGFYSSESDGFGFFTMLVSSLLLTSFCGWLYQHIIWLRLLQVSFVFGFIIYILSYIKSWDIIFLDKNGESIMSIRQTKRNQAQISAAIELIKENNKDVIETSAADPYPPEKPLFSYTHLVNLGISHNNFYQNKIIGVTKTLYSETSFSVEYSDLSEPFRARMNFDVFWFVFSWALIAISIFGWISASFFLPTLESYFILLYSLGAILLLAFLFKFIKWDIFGFRDKNGNVVFWAYAKKFETEKIEEIIKFVQAKIIKETNESEAE